MRSLAQKKRPGWPNRALATSPLVVSCFLFVSGLFVAGLVTAPRLLAQAAASQTPPQSPTASEKKLEFEVASIKLDHSGTQMFSLMVPPGKFTATNVTVKRLIEWAYQDNRDSLQLRDNQIVGGPGWINTEHYDIDAKVEDFLIVNERTMPPNQWANDVKLMVRSMLSERFRLKVSFGTRELPEYALVVAKNGPKLTESTVLPPDPFAAAPSAGTATPKGPSMRMGRGQVTGTGVSIGNLVDMLSQQPDLSGFQVLDHTGLKGSYDFALKWTPEVPVPPAGFGPEAGPPPDTSGVSIFTAMQEQLGLRLETTKGPVEIVVVDSIEEPSPN